MRAHAASWSSNSLPLILIQRYCYLEKVSLVDKLLDHRKEEFKLPNIKKKSSHVLNCKENLKLLKEKEMKKKEEEEEKA